MKLFVRPEAEADLSDAFRWYEQQSAGLGRDFVGQVDDVFSKISERPAQYPIIHAKLRRALTKRFPYAVFFLVETQRIVVFAVLHQATDPHRWQRRND